MSNNYFTKTAKPLDNFGAVSTASYGRTFGDYSGNVGVRASYGKQDYYHFNSSEYMRDEVYTIIEWADRAYKKIGIVKNTIDVMSDFGAKGARIQHENPQIESFYKKWWSHIGGKSLCERFLNLLYKHGNATVETIPGKIKTETPDGLVTKMYKGKSIYKNSKVINTQYRFINPLCIKYDIVKNKKVLRLRHTGTAYNSYTVTKITTDLSSSKIPYHDINLDRVHHFTYKKDDWDSFGFPLHAAILDDLTLYDNLRLADSAALRSIITAVRIWKLGSLEYKIGPSAESAKILKQALASVGFGGSADIIWDAAIDLVETNSQAYQFLGLEKYEPTLNAIYIGMGIPPALTGASGSGLTSSHISLKTMTERLDYGRNILVGFWEKEFDLIAKSMGFESPATLTFDTVNFSDETAEKALMIQLLDRVVFSDEFIREKFGANNPLEIARLTREKDMRDKEVLAAKASPFHNPVGENHPSFVRGEELTGRPKGSKDKNKRKQKVVKPSSIAHLYTWANEAYVTVSENLSRDFLNIHNKKNIRMLTSLERQNLDDIKRRAFSNLPPMKTIDMNDVYNKLEYISENISVSNLYQQFVKEFRLTNNREPSLEENKNLNISAYVMAHKT